MLLSDYVYKPILASLTYNKIYQRFNTRCFVYPRYVKIDKKFVKIDPTDFPTRGSVEVYLADGNESAEEVYARLGSLVTIRFNVEPNLNERLSSDDQPYSHYFMRYSSQQGKLDSPIWIEAFNGKEFYQVINADEDISALLKQRKVANPEEGVFTNQILLRHEQVLYGPFEYDLKDDTLRLNGLSVHQHIVGEYSAKDFETNFLQISNESQYKKEVTLLQSSVLPLPNECEKKYDFISDEKLIETFLASLRADTQYTKNEINQIKDRLDEVLKSNGNIAKFPERSIRIQKLIENESVDNQCTQNIIRYALDDADLIKKISDFIVANNFASVREKLLKYAETQQYITDYKNSENTRIAQLEKSKTSDISESKDADDASKEIIKKLKDENEALKNKISTEKTLCELQAECEIYTEKRKEAKQKYDSQLIDNSELEKKFKETLENFNDKANQTAKVLDKVLLDKIIRGIDDHNEEASPLPFDKTSLYPSALSAKDIIEHVTRFITEKGHRDITENDVANYLICITQGFITTFAGEPGTGKTSLCNLLAKALGLCADYPNTRYIDISVERGWVSHKDFIGYYNPLTKSLVKSNADVFEAFMAISKECECDPKDIAPYVILLDEANLSPIEHYWATFLRYCDTSSSIKRSISLGGNELINLPTHLRFLATVNFDHTTEELSPRFIDRSWIITLNPTRIDDDETTSPTDNSDKIISCFTLKQAFMPDHNEHNIDETLSNKWGAIQEIFKNNSLSIMPRNLTMVKNYCSVACKCMNRDTAVAQLAPLDYALSQKILPTINGTGDNYKKLVSELLKECSAQFMPISNRHLERIEKAATNNLGFYQFFAR